MYVQTTFGDNANKDILTGMVISSDGFTATVHTEADGSDRMVWLTIEGNGFPADVIVHANPDGEEVGGVCFAVEDHAGDYVDELTYGSSADWSGVEAQDIAKYRQCIEVFLEGLYESSWLNDQRILTSDRITTLEQAKAWIDTLAKYGLLFHFDDGAVDTLWHGGLVSLAKARQINERLDEVYKHDFGSDSCPIGYALERHSFHRGKL